ncbi:MAG TPA: type II toxin-antitoxin system HicA family toxin [Gemmatimonadaceae bacterium]|nr:type II toxin-antitoxin system HicA family toxin [Gemmatimonadaceae bacterium]
MAVPVLDKPNVRFKDCVVTWAELIRLLKQQGFEELRSGKGSHRQLWNPTSGRIVTIAVHTKKDVGPGLLHRILKDAGLR